MAGVERHTSRQSRWSELQESNIAWTDLTWNPVHGCSKVSAGCENCYAERISLQYGHTEEEWTNEHASENVTVRPGKLEEPFAPTLECSPEDWVPGVDGGRQPVRVFVNSMSDLFHSEVSAHFIREVFTVMRNTPGIVYQILTKRPGRAAYMDLEWPANVWIGTSVEDDRVLERVDLLRECPAETLFLSCEPLIGPLGDVDLAGYDWVIVGGESGPDDARREMEHAWARDIRRQCQEQDVAFFFKQSSGRQPETGTRLTVHNEEYDTFEQRRIREYPPLPDAVLRAAREVDASA
jgi:protein gp37